MAIDTVLDFNEEKILTHYQRSLRVPLSCTIKRLENPEVRLDNNEPYRMDNESLGILYAAIIESSTSRTSPGKKQGNASHFGESALQELEKTFQMYSRGALARFQLKLELRHFNREGLKENYTNRIFVPDVFYEGSLESNVSKCAQNKNFEKIGQALRKGAESYFDLTVKKNMPHYRFAAEYKSINDALKR
ncbi:hypothetical protein HQ489_00930 [Candidatus Woesearchaeota archaeon]|nr:hypothetical protein [Candidatus Woesearchaeota archaeon]